MSGEAPGQSPKENGERDFVFLAASGGSATKTLFRAHLQYRQLCRLAGAYPSFSSMKQLGVFYSPLDGMLVHSKRAGSLVVARENAKGKT